MLDGDCFLQHLGICKQCGAIYECHIPYTLCTHSALYQHTPTSVFHSLHWGSVDLIYAKHADSLHITTFLGDALHLSPFHQFSLLIAPKAGETSSQSLV